jgi:hypothetical protein
MAVINEEQKWLWLHEPHTAGRSLTLALLEMPGSRDIQPHHCSPEVPADFEIIVTCRNPFDMLVTRWMSLNYRNETFAHFLTMGMDAPSNGLGLRATSYLRYETLTADLKAMFGREIELPMVGRTPKKKNWRTHWTPDDYERYMNRDDWRDYMRQFGYVGSAYVLHHPLGIHPT